MMMRGWANLSLALRTSQGALDDALGMETYAYLQQNTAEAAVFDAAMSSVLSGQRELDYACIDSTYATRLTNGAQYRRSHRRAMVVD